MYRRIRSFELPQYGFHDKYKTALPTCEEPAWIKGSRHEPRSARAHLVHGLPKHAPQKFKEGQGIWHKALGGWVGVEAVVRGGLEESGIGVKALLDQALHELLEETAPINAGLL